VKKNPYGLFGLRRLLPQLGSYRRPLFLMLLTSALGSIVDIVKDEDGRPILDLMPKPPFTVFPDEECLKMIRSLKRIDQLDEE